MQQPKPVATEGHDTPEQHPFEVFAESLAGDYEAYEFAEKVMEPALFHKDVAYRLPVVKLKRAMWNEIRRTAESARECGALLLCGVRS